MLIQKAIVGNFLKPEPHWFKLSYPYFWHPFKGMVKNGTIFMVVAVSAERYRAICYPLSKRQVKQKAHNCLYFFQILVKNQMNKHADLIGQRPIL